MKIKKRAEDLRAEGVVDAQDCLPLSVALVDRRSLFLAFALAVGSAGGLAAGSPRSLSASHVLKYYTHGASGLSLSLSLSLSPSLSRALSLSLSLSLTLSLSLYIYSRDSIVKNYNREGEKTRDPQRSGTRKAI